MTSTEDGRRMTEQQATGHSARMDWAQSVVDYLKVNEAIAEPTSLVAEYQQEGRVQLEKALAQRLVATFGRQDAVVVLGHAYSHHETAEDADHAKSLFDTRHRQLYSIRDPKSYEMIGELKIAQFLRDYFQIGPDFGIDYPSDAQRWGKAVVQHQQYVDNVRSIVKASHPMHRSTMDYAAPIIQQVEEDLDFQLLERMKLRFDSRADEALHVLFGDFGSNEQREAAFNTLYDSLYAQDPNKAAALMEERILPYFYGILEPDSSFPDEQ